MIWTAVVWSARRCDEGANKEDWDRESFSDDREKRKLSILIAEDSYQPKTKSKEQVQATKFNQKGPVQYSTAQYSPLGPDTAQHSPVQYSLVQHSEVQYSLVKFSTA